MENGTVDTCAAKEDEDSESDILCLMRVGKNSGWLRLFENTEITVGRGLDVTYQVVSQTSPFMISRQHCMFKQNEDYQWTVTDTKSLNGVWVNEKRILPNSPHLLQLGDSIQIGVPLTDTGVEFVYILVRRSLKDIKPYLAKAREEVARGPHISRNFKRKLADEDVEPSTSRHKLFHHCPFKSQQRPSPTLSETPSYTKLKEAELPSNSSCSSSDPDYSRSKQVEDIQKQSPSSEVTPKQAEPLYVELLPSQTLLNLAAKEKRPTKQRHVVEDVAVSRQVFEEILSAKNKELEVIKEEKERVKAQKDEVTEVLENELQCIICSELFIEAVSLNCAHSFCLYCIGQWRSKKNECPICRQAIQFQTRCLALDNYIDSVVENLCVEIKARRQAVIAQRKDESAGGHRNIKSGTASN